MSYSSLLAHISLPYTVYSSSRRKFRAGTSELRSYLVDVLAIELLDQLVEALSISLNADRVEDGLDILGGRGAVASESGGGDKLRGASFCWLF